ncbi:hypothetical protein Goari_015309 [Gossypium aridum]|uniref:Homeobox domain-containing protein n=1 Tax=Gossypium aridum TaxID=34290 RepID=A0A7J8XLK1_GOSAI|nr:hypothetical protein [Gossypium aridum]
MERENQHGEEEYLQYQIQNGVCGKVMSDEQVEELKKQIVAYSAISEQLAELHKSMSAHHDFTGSLFSCFFCFFRHVPQLSSPFGFLFDPNRQFSYKLRETRWLAGWLAALVLSSIAVLVSGIRLGNLYCDPISATFGHKITARQRWTPTPLQLQILENIYEKGTGTPSKQKIKEIASELAQHGQISETNVYNWFQNRRARSKRKFQVSTGSANAESEPDGSTKEKKTKPVGLDFIDNFSQGVESFYFQGSESGIDQLMGKEESSRGYDPYNNLVEQFGLLG